MWRVAPYGRTYLLKFTAVEYAPGVINLILQTLLPSSNVWKEPEFERVKSTGKSFPKRIGKVFPGVSLSILSSCLHFLWSTFSSKTVCASKEILLKCDFGRIFSWICE